MTRCVPLVVLEMSFLLAVRWCPIVGSCWALCASVALDVLE